MAELDASLDGIEAVFLDLDGTLYLGDQLVEGALDFLSRLEEAGIRRFFLSNNSSRSVTQYVEKLQGMEEPPDASLLQS
jgi:ribonucleotide monophosphatase NagD (HAD superfamily)